MLASANMTSCCSVIDMQASTTIAGHSMQCANTENDVKVYHMVILPCSEVITSIFTGDCCCCRTPLDLGLSTQFCAVLSNSLQYVNTAAQAKIQQLRRYFTT
jgi:hypothetical protein